MMSHVFCFLKADATSISRNQGAIKWLAPEAILTKRYDEKTDSYSFAIVLWELVTRGKEPYEGEEPIPIALGVTQVPGLICSTISVMDREH